MSSALPVLMGCDARPGGRCITIYLVIPVAICGFLVLLVQDINDPRRQDPRAAGASRAGKNTTRA